MKQKYITPVDCYDDVRELFFPSQPEITELTISNKAWFKIQCFIRLVGDLEVNGFGKIVDNVIEDVIILDQKVTGTTCEASDDVISQFLLSLPAEERGLWTLDWHSHVDMGCFYSGTDTSNYEKQWEARLKRQFPVMVVNKKSEYKLQQFINPKRYEDIKLFFTEFNLDEDEMKDLYAQCKKEVETKVWKQVYEKKKQDSSTWYLPNYSTKSKGLSKQDIKQGYKQITLDGYCEGCGSYLWRGSEQRRGYCDDCWQCLSIDQRLAIIEDRNIKNAV